MPLDTVAGSTAVKLLPSIRVVGYTLVSAAGVAVPPGNLGVPDEVQGATAVSVLTTVSSVGTPDEVDGSTVVVIVQSLGFSANPPMRLALEFTGDLSVVPPDLGDLDL